MLMELFQNGKEAAFDEIYRRYSQRLLHFMYRLLNQDESKAQDMLHDVFIRLVERPDRFDTTRNFQSWIFTVCSNECKKQHRSAHDHVDVEQGLHIGIPSEVKLDRIDQKGFRQALRSELQLLSYDHQCTFILRFQENFEVREVAEIMNCSEGTVKSRSHYCLKKLAAELAVYNPINTI